MPKLLESRVGYRKNSLDPSLPAALRPTRCSGPGGSEVTPATTATQNTSTQAGTTMAPELGPRRTQAVRAGMLQPPTPGSGAGGRAPLRRLQKNTELLRRAAGKGRLAPAPGPRPPRPPADS